MRKLNILIVDDEEIVHETLGDYLQDLGHGVEHASCGTSGLAKLRKNAFDVALVDVQMPRMNGLVMVDKGCQLSPETSFVIITGYADIQTAVEALRRGASDFLIKPVKVEELEAVLEKALRLSRLRRESWQLRNTMRGIQNGSWKTSSWQLVGESQAARDIRRQVTEAVLGDCDTILITGETGTGKEVVARAIHMEGAGAEKPFIAVNCPAIHENLAETELFGHTKGAFTGATQDRAGAFELADGGTLFLDEVGDLSLAAQADLLRVVETRKFRRVGGAKEINVSLRLIAATNMDLKQAVADGAFRRDLYYRLNVYHIHTPPLRERREDVVPLARCFISAIAETRGCECEGITEGAEKKLSDFEFSGNIRELRNAIERGCIGCRLHEDRVLDVHHFGHLCDVSSDDEDSSASSSEEARLRHMLEQCKWNRRQAAKMLDIPYSTFRYKLKQYGI